MTSTMDFSACYGQTQDTRARDLFLVNMLEALTESPVDPKARLCPESWKVKNEIS